MAFAAAFFSGYPGSGSFTRSAVNFRSGARTPMSGIISGVAVAVTVLLAAPLAASLPVAALAGVLLVVAAEMIGGSSQGGMGWLLISSGQVMELSLIHI